MTTKHDGTCALQHLENALYASPIEPVDTWMLCKLLRQAKMDALDCSRRWAEGP